jgi:hypothetical protein
LDHHASGDESDVDCGGILCAQCILGQKCNYDNDCTTNACDGNTRVCIVDQCADHRVDGTETDIDCGGANACSRCTSGRWCKVDSDCQAGLKCEGTNLPSCY